MYLDKYFLSLITEACLLCLTKNYEKKVMTIINSLILGYNDRRRNNDNESTTLILKKPMVIR